MEKRKFLFLIVGVIITVLVLSGCVTAPQPPTAPTYLYPSNNQTNVSNSPTLSWTDSGQNLTYNVYFGTSSNPPEVAAGISGASYTPANLAYSTTYYWRVVAQNQNGVTSSGGIETFVTEANPTPPPPSTQNITGSWDFSGTLPGIQGQISAHALVIQKQDNKSDVVLVLPIFYSGENWDEGGIGLTGTLNGETLALSTNIDGASITLQGTLSNGVISGTISGYENNQQISDSFQMTNKQSLIVNQATDISGNWNFTLNDQTRNQTYPTAMTIYQDGSDVVAVITSTTLSLYSNSDTLAGAALYGTLDGNSIDFALGLLSNADFQLNGTLLTAQSMNGTFQFTGGDSGTWSAQFVSK